MCCLIVCPGRKRPSLKTLRSVVRANPHGLGIAWRKQGQIAWYKSDDVEEIHARVSAIPRTVVVHARWATVGGAIRELRHPFPVTEDVGLAIDGMAPAVLFQNGTWLDWREEVEDAVDLGHTLPEGPMSDSRAAAWMVHLKDDYKWLASISSRWVYWQGGTAPVMIGRFETYEGCKFSKMNWLYRSRKSIIRR